ncbi:MAG: hypothetical protein HKN13_07430 [Rhodothermales bacterium]|nr:hypothetical protein [Rhodothermales bacterium]
MKIEPFKLERFFAPHEFAVKHVLCASDCETMTMGELMELDPDLESALRNLKLSYSPMEGREDLRREIAGLYQEVGPQHGLITPGGRKLDRTPAASDARDDDAGHLGEHAEVDRTAPKGRSSLSLEICRSRATAPSRRRTA